MDDMTPKQQQTTEIDLVIVASSLPIEQIDAAVEHRAAEAGLGRYQTLALVELSDSPFLIERVATMAGKAHTKKILIIGRFSDAEVMRNDLLGSLPAECEVFISDMVAAPSPRKLPLVLSCGCCGTDRQFVSAVLHAFGLHERSFRTVTVPGGVGGMKRQSPKTQLAAEQLAAVAGSTSCVIVLGHVGCPASGVSYAPNVEAGAVELATGEAVTALYDAQSSDRPSDMCHVVSESMPTYAGIMSMDGGHLVIRRPD